MDVVLLWTCVTASVIVLLYLCCRDGSERGKIEKQKGKPNEPVAFELKNLVSPSLTGWRLYFFSYILRMKMLSPLTNLLLAKMKRQSNMGLLHKYKIPDAFTFYPQVRPSKQQEEHEETNLEMFLKCRSNQNGFSYVSIFELVDAYRSGKITPLQVTENALGAIEKSEKLDKKMRIFVQFNKEDALRMANESTKRYLDNKTLSVVDGIPVALKEDYETVGYHIRMGTTFIGSELADRNCNLVAKLRELGCVILGLTNMHELGFGTTGNNPNYLHGSSRNPHDVDYHCGGSSGGSAAAVAAGICPVALGRDDGGSIRIPAAVCGVVGIKATFGRISGHSNVSSSGTVSHPGPICNNVRDTALMYALLSGRDVDDSPGLIQPEHATLEGFENSDMSDIKIGIDWRFSEFCDLTVVKPFKEAVKYLKQQGAIVSSINIPELEEARVAHLISSCSEGVASVENLHPDKMGNLNPETFILLAVLKRFTAAEYVLAQKQRTRSMKFMKDIFSDVDVILTPATSCIIPKIPEDSVKYGMLDFSVTGKLMRYTFLANLTGIPGVVVPFAYDDNDLPIGVQVMTSWWDEHVAFRVAHCLEQRLVRRRPKVHYNIINPSESVSMNDDN